MGRTPARVPDILPAVHALTASGATPAHD